jgi:hypothetical protein
MFTGYIQGMIQLVIDRLISGKLIYSTCLIVYLVNTSELNSLKHWDLRENPRQLNGWRP